MAFRSVRDDAQPTLDGGARAAQPRRDYPSDHLSLCTHTDPDGDDACAIGLRAFPGQTVWWRVAAVPRWAARSRRGPNRPRLVP